MISRFKRFVVATAATLFALNPLMASASVCGPAETLVGFTNGIQNTRDDAREGLDTLASHSKSHGISPASKVLFYHQKGRPGAATGLSSFKLDVLEVYWQLAKETVGNDPAREAEAMALFHHAVQNDDTNSGIRAKLLAWLMQTEDTELQNSLQYATSQNVASEVSNDVTLLTDKLSSGNLVMMAAHSQGTLWANAALSQFAAASPQLASHARLSSAGAAASYVWQTPGSSVPNAYATSDNDLVINTIRSLASSQGMVSPLSANTSHALSVTSPTGHPFVGIYLDEKAPTGQLFMTNFVQGVNQLFAENKQGSTLLTSDVSVNIGTVGQQMLDSGKWTEDFTYQTLQNDAGTVLVGGKETRTAAQTLRVQQTWFCSIVGSGTQDVTPLTIPMTVALPSEIGQPSQITGTVTLDGKVYQIKNTRSVSSEVGFIDWAYANLTVSRAQGAVSASLSPL